FPQGLPARRRAELLSAWRRQDGRTEVALGASPSFPWTAVKDVGEFDSPHHRTPLLARLAAQALAPAAGGERILAFNPEHGFLPALLLETRRPAEIALLGRDTLAEQAARANIAAALQAWGRTEETRLVPAPALAATPWLPAPAGALDPGYDLIAGPLLWKEGPRALAATLSACGAALRADGKGLLLLAVGTSQMEGLKRPARAAGLAHGREARHKGNAALCLRRK
ncbi:MAG: hypothetical protein HY812_09905, partial [Planctomycetes bacterium]|nr:hypothetical protein [Planctomycetota bacterium]